VRVDVTEPASCRDAVAAVVRAWDRLDVLVNNAGRLVTPHNRQTLEETDEREWDATMNVNLRGTYFMSRAAAAAMIPRKRGAIVNIASTAARQFGPENIAYNVSKGGVLSLTGTLAIALAAHGIRVNGVAPMMTITDTRPRTRMDHVVAKVPLGKLATPDDVAGPVLFLASDESGHVTGHTIVVDGGLSIRRPW
jgi:NAD(P)-dependent dehydrogenase (short-subunit alcohol dehydrogenase family)